jgi:hypothetical protein
LVSTEGITGSLTRFARGLPAVLRFALSALFVVTIGSCHSVPKPDGEVRVTTARELVKQYRDDPGAARLHFTGQLVRVRVTAVVVEGTEAHWKFAFAPAEPPAIVFRFDAAPTLSPPCFIEGISAGRVDDGKARDVPGYTFSVTLTSCRVVPESP